jgi:carboxyl-terminal processing protease
MLDEELPLGYVHILRFTSLTPDELREAIASLQAEGMQGLVLDLRDNSGGLLQESIDIAGEFLDGEVIFREKTRAEGEVVTEDDLGGVLTELPMVVITNNRTGSAAEIVAGALKDNDRALVIGQQTLGKGSVQFIFPLEDGSSIHITTAVWFTPNNDPIDNVGLVPDIAMIPDENGRDVELGEAIRQLQTAIVTNASQ